MPAQDGAALRAGCEIDLGFPFQRPESPAHRLRALADEIEARGYGWEYYAGGETAQALESRIAALTGKPAALWFPTGTMAQGIAARIHCAASGRPVVALHPTSHLLLHEEDGIRHVHGLDVWPVGDWNAVPEAADVPDGAGCFILELAQRHNGGLAPSWAALMQLQARLRDAGTPLHMDGARLWAVRGAFDNRSYAEICDGFDSVYVSLYKDLGAISGAVLTGSAAFIAQARIWRSRMGGLMPVALPNTADALRRLDDLIAEMPDCLARARALAAQLAELPHLHVRPPATNLFHIGVEADLGRIDAARDQVAQEMGIWLFSRCWTYPPQPRPAIEMNVGGKLLDIGSDRILDGFARFSDLLHPV